MKKFLTIGVSIVLLAVIALLVIFRMFVTGAAGFDDWVMRQVLGVAQTYLVPTIEFDSFNYEAPLTVTFEGVRLVSPDGTEVVNAGELVVTLGKIPRRGEPIVINGITVRDGVVKLIANPDDPNTTFKGLAPFVKRSNIERQDQLGKEVQLSETLELRTIELHNAAILFDPSNGQPPMMLDALTMAMNIAPTVDRVEGLWHVLDINIDRGELFAFTVDGRLNLNTLAAKLDELFIRVDVGASSVRALPPQIQEILADHDAKGLLEINMEGDSELKNWRASNLSGEIKLVDFNLGFSEYRVPIDSGVMPIGVGDGTAKLGPVQIKSLDGILQALFTVDLKQERLPAEFQWTLAGLDLHALLRTAAPEGEPPKFAGDLGTFGSATANLTDLPATIEGNGEGHIVDGRLVNFPGVRLLNRVLSVGPAAGGEDNFNDRFDVVFSLTDEGFRIDSSTLETRAVLARGTGMVYYDQRLDLTINAGPMEKLQSLLGKVGKAIGKITDQLVDYRITGTVSEPEIRVKPLGIGWN